jgi:hypothetical protein
MDELVALIVVFGWAAIVLVMAFAPEHKEARGRVVKALRGEGIAE